MLPGEQQLVILNHKSIVLIPCEGVPPHFTIMPITYTYYVMMCDTDGQYPDFWNSEDFPYEKYGMYFVGKITEYGATIKLLQRIAVLGMLSGIFFAEPLLDMNEFYVHMYARPKYC